MALLWELVRLVLNRTLVLGRVAVFNQTFFFNLGVGGAVTSQPEPMQLCVPCSGESQVVLLKTKLLPLHSEGGLPTYHNWKEGKRRSSGIRVRGGQGSVSSLTRFFLGGENTCWAQSIGHLRRVMGKGPLD